MSSFSKEIRRIFSKSALLKWFTRMQSDWERQFSELELSRGRDLYKNEQVSELELTEDDAFIRLGRDTNFLYAVVYWENNLLKIRGSMEQQDEAASIAVAGLYEIEALLADEIGHLSLADEPKKRINSDELNTIKNVANNITEDSGDEVSESENDDARDLLLRFYVTVKGLHLEPLWLEGKKRIPVFKGKEFNTSNSAGERGKIIRLLGRLRKTKFEATNHGFLISDVGSIFSFFSGELKHLNKYFSVELDPSVDPLKKGNRLVKVEIEINAYGKNDLQLHWNLYLGKTVLSPDIANKLIHKIGKGPQIVPSVGILSVSQETAEKLLEWEPILVHAKDGILPRYMMFSLFAGNTFPVRMDNDLSSWFENIADGSMESRMENVPDFLRLYQKRGVAWLAQLCAQGCHPLVADEMGLGKTLQMLTLLAQFPIESKPALVVCPASVVPVWQHEAERFYPTLRVSVLRSDLNFSMNAETDLWIASYAQLRGHQHLLGGIDFGYAVLDEAQMVKNPDAKSTQACLDIKAEHRIVLTGTPVENKHCDLWTLFRFLMPGLLGQRKFFEMALEKDGQRFLHKLNKQLAPFILRRTKREVMQELPEKTEMDLVCLLTPTQANEYRMLTEHATEEFGNDISKAINERAMSLFSLLTRLRQVCCDPGLLPWKTCSWQESGKIQVLMSQLELLLSNNHRVVIFSQFVSFLNRIREAITATYPNAPLYELTGKTQDRSRPVQEFQLSRGGSIMLVSLRAGGTGITLHAADYVFLMDPWWNPAVENQAIDRVHRIGQDKPVFIYRMVTEGTIEERIQELKNKKRDLFDRLLGHLGDISDFSQYFSSLSELIDLRME